MCHHMEYWWTTKLVSRLCKTSFIGPHKFEIEHLERVTTDDNAYWRYPLQDDIQTINSDQILPCKINGTWDLGVNARMMKFVFKNAVPINNTFQKFLNA